MRSIQKKTLLISAATIGLVILLALPGMASAKKRYPNGTLVRQKNKSTIYLIKKNRKRPILSIDVMRQRNLLWKRVRTLSKKQIKKIPTGRLFIYKNNTLLRARNKKTIWVIKGQKRKSASSMALLRALGYHPANTRVIPNKKLKKIRSGGSLSLGIKRFIKVTANRPYWVKDSRNRRLARVSAKKITQVGYRRGVYLISIPSKKKTIRRSSWIKIQPVSGGIVQLPSYDRRYGYNRFRGKIQIRYSKKSKKLWAISQVSLENYLKGMGEAGNTLDNKGDRLTYQKTMAIIARSYAAYYLKRGGRHRGEPFHLKNSRYGNGMDQVYHGYKREFGNQVKSVNQTRGTMVTNRSGRILITPYSHGGWVWEKNKNTCRNHGGIPYRTHKCLRTRNSQEVWGGTISHCKRVADRYGDKGWQCGTNGNHCVGLSATGAIGYARNDGRSHQWILKHYYRGARVTKKGYNPSARIAIYGVRP